MASTISGTVTLSGSGLAGVTITVRESKTGYSRGSTTTASDGTWSITGTTWNFGDPHTFTPTKTGYTFSPTSTTFTVYDSQTYSGKNFTATAVTVNVSGQVTEGGVGLSGVTITFSGGSTVTATTDASGNWTATPAQNAGSCTITPTKTDYTFSPTSDSVTVATSNITGKNFTATADAPATYDITGSVTGTIVEDVTITLTASGFTTATTSTGSDGTFGFYGLSDNTYTVTPSHADAGYSFSPTSREAVVDGADVAVDAFTSSGSATPPTPGTITGTITGPSGWSVESRSVSITAPAGSAQTVQTDATGTYTFSNVPAGSTTVTPGVVSGYYATPANRTTTVVTGETSTLSAFVYSESPVASSIEGTVWWAAAPTTQKTVTLTITKNGAAYQTKSVTVTTTGTGSDGAFTIDSVFSGTYVLTPSLSGYTFLHKTAGTASYTVTVDNSGSAFAAGDWIPTLSGPATYTVSGYCFDVPLGASAWVYMVPVTPGGSTYSALVDGLGFYHFDNIPAGSYTVTPNCDSGSFEPLAQTITLSGGDVRDVNFQWVASSAPGTYTISGTVFGPVVENVLVTITGTSLIFQDYTDVAGLYSVASVPNGTYIIVPTYTGYGFTPTSITCIVNGANMTQQNFTSWASGGGGGGGGGEEGTEEGDVVTTINKNIVVVAGDAYNFTILLVDSEDDPLDISSWRFFFTAKSSYNDADADAVIAIDITPAVAPLSGLTGVTLTPTNTAITPGDYYYDIQAVDGSSNPYTLVRGTLTILAGVTTRTS